MKQVMRAVTLGFCVLFLTTPVWGFAAAATNGYLTYQEPEPAASSVWSTLAYLLSLLFVFAVVIGLAYATSRFLGLKLGRLAGIPNNKILFNIPLGPNRGIYAVEIAGKVLILGVTEHNMVLLQEITSPEAIEALKQEASAQPATKFDVLLQKSLHSLQHMPAKYPRVFGQTKSAPPQEKRQLDDEQKNY